MKVQSFYLSFECEAKCYKHYCRNNKKNWRVKFLNFLLSDENGELPSYVPEEQGSFKSTVVPLTHSW